jgi:hypothetical protein
MVADAGKCVFFEIWNVFFHNNDTLLFVKKSKDPPVFYRLIDFFFKCGIF